MTAIEHAYAISTEKHKHLCPRQVLGVRIGFYAGDLLGITFPQVKKMVYTIVETDGCFLDGVAAATGCEPGRRTMRVEDYGKVAATFVRIATGEAFRIVPRAEVRHAAQRYVPESENRWEMMQRGYMCMTSKELLNAYPVELTQAIGDIISRAGVRVNCDLCQEEIINEREIIHGEQTLCYACASSPYYQPIAESRYSLLTKELAVPSPQG